METTKIKELRKNPKLRVYNKFGDCLGGLMAFSDRDLRLMVTYKDCSIRGV